MWQTCNHGAWIFGRRMKWGFSILGKDTTRPPAHFVWKIDLSINSCDCTTLIYAGRVQKTHPGNLDVGLYVGHPCMVKSSCLFWGPDAKRVLLPQNTSEARATGAIRIICLQFALVCTISKLPMRACMWKNCKDMYHFLQNQWQEPRGSFHDPKVSSGTIPWQGDT